MWTYWHETDITYQICILGDSWTESWSLHSFHSLAFVTLSSLIECFNSLETIIISLGMMLMLMHRYTKYTCFWDDFFLFTYTFFVLIDYIILCTSYDLVFLCFNIYFIVLPILMICDIKRRLISNCVDLKTYVHHNSEHVEVKIIFTIPV